MSAADEDLGAFTRSLMRERLAALVGAVRDRASSVPAPGLPEHLGQTDDLLTAFASAYAGEDVPHHDMRESMMRMVVADVIEALPLVELALLARIHWDGPDCEEEEDWPEEGLPHASTLQQWLAEAVWPILQDAAREDGRCMLRAIEERGHWIAEDWPLGEPVMAWCPPGANPEIAAVPIGPDDLRDGLTTRDYLRRLTTRLRWMLAAESDPDAALRDVASALRFRDLCSLLPDDEALPPSERLGRMIEGNALLMPALLPVLALPADEPWAVANSPEAVSAVRTVRLSAWIAFVT